MAKFPFDLLNWLNIKLNSKSMLSYLWSEPRYFLIRPSKQVDETMSFNALEASTKKGWVQIINGTKVDFYKFFSSKGHNVFKV